MSFDFQSDPELARIRAEATAGRDRQLAQVREARRQALINFGSPELARAVLGNDDPTIAAIGNNPNASNSILAQINRANEGAVDQAEAGYSSGSNLFYSGARAKGLADLAQSKVRQQADAEAQLRQQLSGFTGAEAAAEEDMRSAISGAQSGAYERAMQQALDYGIGPTGDEPGGGPPGPPGGPPTPKDLAAKQPPRRPAPRRPTPRAMARAVQRPRQTVQAPRPRPPRPPRAPGRRP